VQVLIRVKVGINPGTEGTHPVAQFREADIDPAEHRGIPHHMHLIDKTGFPEKVPAGRLCQCHGRCLLPISLSNSQLSGICHQGVKQEGPFPHDYHLPDSGKTDRKEEKNALLH
jgi:hypothetical protein